MSKLVDSVPDFLCIPAAIDAELLPTIREEGRALFEAMYEKVEHKDRGFYYFKYFADVFGDLATYCPVLVSELQRLKIYEFFERALFIQQNFKGTMPVHRDYLPTDDYNHFGLNIPICGYEGSCTIFYEGMVYDNSDDETEEIKSILTEHYGTTNVKTAPVGIPETLKEIARVPTGDPVWFNTWVLHAGYSESDEPRMIVSLRFSDMSHLFDNGYFDEHLVAH